MKLGFLGEWLIKTVAKRLAEIDGKTFDKVVSTVSRVGQDENFKNGMEEAEEVVRLVKPDFNLPEQLFWVIGVVVKLAYAVARLKNLPT